MLFMDFEASGLGPRSWPIEIGFAWLIGRDLRCESRLIRPHSTWEPAAWSAESALIHGIALAELASAAPAEEIARWVAAFAHGRHLISDAPEFDQRWLDRLLDLDPGLPSMTIVDFDAAVAASFGIEAIYRVYAELDAARAGVDHRAGPDAKRLARAWRAGQAGS